MRTAAAQAPLGFVRPNCGLKYELHPHLDAWAGTWTGGEDRIVISPAKDGTKLRLRGYATWHGPNAVEHFGDVEGDVIPAGNRVRLTLGGSVSCALDLVLLGNIILASDNNLCGGMNVRFEGFWKRDRENPRSTTRPNHKR